MKTRKKTRVRSRLAPEKTSDNELLPPWRDEAEQDRSRRLGMVLQHYCADVSSAGESFGELIMHTALSRYANTDNAFSDARDTDFLYCSDDLDTANPSFVLRKLGSSLGAQKVSFMLP